MVVLALLQGLAEALTQGQVALGGGAVQELPDLIGAGPHLQGLRGGALRGLGHSVGGSRVSSGWAPGRTPKLGVAAAPPQSPRPWCLRGP